MGRKTMVLQVLQGEFENCVLEGCTIWLQRRKGMMNNEWKI